MSGYRALLRQDARLETHDRVAKRRFFYRGDESCARTEIVRYQRLLARLRLGKTVLIASEGGIRDEYETVLLFKPPFGPYPAELGETFPIGQSKTPEWDEALVRQGCRGINILKESHPGNRFFISGFQHWTDILRQECGDSLEVID